MPKNERDLGWIVENCCPLDRELVQNEQAHWGFPLVYCSNRVSIVRSVPGYGDVLQVQRMTEFVQNRLVRTVDEGVNPVKLVNLKNQLGQSQVGAEFLFVIGVDVDIGLFQLTDTPSNAGESRCIRIAAAGLEVDDRLEISYVIAKDNVCQKSRNPDPLPIESLNLLVLPLLGFELIPCNQQGSGDFFSCHCIDPCAEPGQWLLQPAPEQL